MDHGSDSDVGERLDRLARRLDRLIWNVRINTVMILLVAFDLMVYDL